VRAVWKLRWPLRATGLRAASKVCVMSQVQGAASAAYPIPWYLQQLQPLQSSDATGSEQTRAGGSAQAFDPFAGLGGGTQPSAGAPTPPFSLDTMSALIGAQEQSGGL